MSFRRFTIAEMLSVTGPWVTLGHAERLLLESLMGAVGLVRFIDSVHAALLAWLTDDERERLGLLRDGIGLKNRRHDVLARIIWHILHGHEYLHGDTAQGRAITDVRTVMFPDNLNIVRVGYRESAGRATARISQLTGERSLVLANIPVQSNTLLELVLEWNQVGVEMGDLQDQRVTPARSPSERGKRRATRDRWIRVVNTVIGTLKLEAEDREEARRVIDRIAGIQAEVGRRLRLADGNAPDGEDSPEDGIENGTDDELGTEPGQEHDVLSALVAESR